MASLSAEAAPPIIPDSGVGQAQPATAGATQSGVSKFAGRLASSFDEVVGKYSEQIANLVGWTTDVAGGITRTVDRVLSALLGGGAGPPAGGSPFGDSPMAPVPAVPIPSPAGGLSFSGSGTSHSDSELMLEEFAIVVLSLICLLQGSKLLRRSGEVLKPGSLSQLAIERPG
jgi:hypothetical protein